MSLRRALLWLPVVLYMALIFHFSSESDPFPTLTTHVWDKLLHLTEYAGLAFLVCRAFAGEGLSWPAAIALAVVVTSVYGMTDEWHQAFVPSRTSDIHDWLADSLGATAGALLCRAARRRQ
jgi:VanZ family protein